MKNMKVLIVLAVFFVSLFSIGCDKTMQPMNMPAPTTVPTAAPTAAASTLTVGANIATSMGSSSAIIVLANGATPLTGATITVNGETIPEMGGGTYMLTTMAAVLATGATVTLSVTSSAGNASASGAFPASPGGTISIPVTGAAAGSTMMLTNT